MIATDSSGPDICIIGAGCSGFTMAKRLKDFGLAYDCFELSDNVGGNWYFDNPNGLSSCYESLHIDTSKWRLAFEDYPVPDDWPDFPHHAQIFQYFQDYVDHFDLRKTITFNTGVAKAERKEGGGWTVTLTTGDVRDYAALIVCNGHHWDPRLPDYPGTFDGHQTHSHHYRSPFSPHDYRGERVMVVGGGNSAMDIASELGQKPLSEKLFISMRRGVWVMPKYRNGQPSDKAALPPWIPMKLGRALARRAIKQTIGRMEDYGLPKPDHEPLDGHPSVSGEFLTRVGCGDIAPKGAIDRLDGRTVRFADGSSERIDAIIWATGYNIRFPFFDDPALQPVDNAFPLFKRMVRPGIDNLFFLGLAQPLPTLVNLAEQQSKFVVAALNGDYQLPSATDMERVIKADEAIHLGHFYESKRHTIQVDFGIYCRDLIKEIGQGAKRAA
jgi:cation diffusion facilitator CzcD-associated flavoprotein CzcO